MWRKNRKPEGNTFGVDQNRNYEVAWHTNCGGSAVPATETYRYARRRSVYYYRVLTRDSGLSPNSEEETQVMNEFSIRHNLAKMLDFHSTGREVLIGFLCLDLNADFDDYIVEAWQRAVA